MAGRVAVRGIGNVSTTNTRTWPCCGLLCAHEPSRVTRPLFDETYIHIHSPALTRDSEDHRTDEVSEWNLCRAPCGMVVRTTVGVAVVVDRGGSVDQIWAQFSNSSRSREAPHTLACGPDASESASKSECPRILYQATILLRTRVRRRSRDPAPGSPAWSPAGEPERTPGTTRAPGGTRRGTIHGTACCLSCLMSTCRALESPRAY